jgi:site-specific recombinase XerC
MRLYPEHALALLPRVDPDRFRWGWPVGLRDGALLALIAAGLNAVQIAALRASDITMSGGRVVVTVKSNGPSWPLPLPMDLGARVLAWLSERRLWGMPEPVFPGARGPLTAIGVRKVLARYSRRRTPKRPAPVCRRNL